MLALKYIKFCLNINTFFFPSMKLAKLEERTVDSLPLDIVKDKLILSSS